MLNQKKNAILFTILLNLLASTTVRSEDVLPLVNLLTENYGAFNYSLLNRDYEHKEENIGGSSTDIVKKLMAESGISYRMKLRAWTVAYGRALERPNYGVFSTSRTDAREPFFEWIGPIASYELALFTKKGSNIVINNINDLKALRVGGYEGDAATNILVAQGIEVSTLTNDSLNPRRLHDDLIDVWVAGALKAYSLAEESGYPDIEKAYVIQTVDMYLAMNPKTDPIVLEKLNKAFDTLLENGAIDF